MKFHLIMLSVFVLLVCQLHNVTSSSAWNATTFIQSSCTLLPGVKSQEVSLENFIEREIRLIALDIHLYWKFGLPNNTYPERVSWLMTTDDTGKRLLLLDDNFASMSLGTLSYNTEQMTFSLIQEPDNCLSNFTVDSVHKIIIFSLLTLPNNTEKNERILQICTGSGNKEGSSCCKLTLNGESVICEPLIKDSIIKVFEVVALIVAFAAISHGAYLIPKSVKTKNYYVIDATENDENPITAKDSLLISEQHISKGLIFNIYKILNDVFCRCILKNYQICEKCCFGIPFTFCGLKKITCFMYLRLVFSMIILFIVTFIRLSFPLFANIFKLSPRFSLLFVVVFLIVYLLALYLRSKLFKDDDELVDEISPIRLDKKFKICLSFLLYPVNKYRNKCFAYLCLLLTIPPSFILYGFMSLPLLSRYLKRCSPKRKKNVVYCLIILICNYFLLLIIADFISFYAICFLYIILGLCLNYRQIIDDVILIILVLSYVFDSINAVFWNINSFHKKIFTIIEEDYKNIIKRMFDYSVAENRNIAFKIVSENQSSSSNSEKGLYLFYKYNNSENTSYLHIPEKFLDQMASANSHVTPGHKFILFYKALREICFLIVLVGVANYVVRGFSRNNEFSATVHTLLSFGTSALLALLNKLTFGTRQACISEYRMQLKSLLNKQLEAKQADAYLRKRTVFYIDVV